MVVLINRRVCNIYKYKYVYIYIHIFVFNVIPTHKFWNTELCRYWLGYKPIRKNHLLLKWVVQSTNTEIQIYKGLNEIQDGCCSRFWSGNRMFNFPVLFVIYIYIYLFMKNPNINPPCLFAWMLFLLKSLYVRCKKTQMSTPNPKKKT